MRDVMRVLFKNAKIERATSSFAKIPSPKALYYAFMWLAIRK